MAPRAHTDLLFGSTRALLREVEQLPEPDHALAPPGLLEVREGACLYGLGRRSEALGDAVEIGAFRGRSTWYLARALEDASSQHRVVSIDPHLEGTAADFAANAEESGLAHRIDARTGYSHDLVGAVAGPIGLLWIDGDHSYAAAKRDFDDWFPRLAVGGWVAFHDTVNLWYGPTRLVRELLLHRADLASIGVIGSITFARKAPPSFINRLGALRARAAFELVVVVRARRFGVGPLHAASGER